MNKNNKWKMNRTGLLNFWYYDDEIFDFADGKLLLRGSNGSGKSVTMQSILPVLLDGKKSPDRLDPFGSRARKMEDYLLGEKDIVERDERTGYLFLEYKREDTNQYVTTGIGLQARRNKNMNFWGFVITDNRRIGIDFPLYETETNGGEMQRIPLSRVQLENRIGDGGKVVRTQGEYMDLVNKHIFGFKDKEAYDDLIKLLIQLRSPKLSKEFRPTAIYEILEAALPPLTDNDLRHLSDTIEHMDQTKQQIEQLEREQQALNKLLKRYDAYNAYKLADKAKNYIDARNKYQKVDQSLVEKEGQAEVLRQEINQLTERQHGLTQELGVLEQKRTRLQSHQVWNLEKEKNEETQALTDIRDEFARKENALTTKKRQEFKMTESSDQLDAELHELDEAVTDQLSELAEDAADASFAQHDMNENDFNRNRTTGYDFTVWKKEAEHHFQKLESITDKLSEYERMKSDITSLDKEIADTKLEVDQLKQEENDWQQIFEKDKQEKLAEIHAWAEEHDFLQVDLDLTQQTSRDMYRIYEQVSYEAVRSPYAELINDYQMEKKETIAGKNSDVKQLDAAIHEKETILDELKTRKDPEPPNQREETRAARAALKADGHHFVPLYEAVEFQDHVPESVQKHIEAALIDAGLLDALVTDSQTPLEHDRIIRAQPNMMAHTLADYLTPDDSQSVSAVKIDEVLRSILVDGETDGDAAVVHSNGTYRVGLMQGHAVPVEQVRFIGKAARERFRQEQIAAITSEIEDLKREKKQVLHEIGTLQTEIQAAKDALNVFPNDADLQEGYSQIKAKRLEINQFEKTLHNLDEKLNGLYRKFREAKAILDKESRNLDVEFSYDAYREAKGIMRTYEKGLHTLITYHTTYCHTDDRLQQTKSRLSELVEEADELQGELNVLTDKKQQKQQNIAEIDQQLELEGVSDIREQIQNVQQELMTTENALDQTKTDLPHKEAELNMVKQETDSLEQKVRFWQGMTDAWEESFVQEKQLDFVELPDDTGDGAPSAEKIAASFKDVLQGKDASVLEGQLTNAFYEQLPNLMEYRMKESDTLASVHDWMQEEWTEDQRIQIDNWRQKTNRRLIQLDFQGKLVSPYYIRQKIESDRIQQQTMLDTQDRQLYEEILFDSVGKKLRSRISRAQSWTEQMNKLMVNSDSSSGLTFSIKWRPRTAETEAELDTKELVALLRRDARLLKEDDRDKIIEHFRSKIDRAKELVDVQGDGNTLLQVLKHVLDYRNWFSFVLSYKRTGESVRELTNHAFYKFSGGEKAMAMYIPLFTACYSRYLEADATAPYIISLDEAFAGVDENNIREMFEIVEELGFDYMMNSQVLWGDYDTISSLAVYDLVRPKNASFVTVIRYYWDGKTRHLLTDQMEKKEPLSAVDR
ncbi:TIGR02680 family protein [Virgibacillus siamensis]|uniref:TIGR02680 family protein n=1 Tax=Virgibacillus siamensis TaxID=480071 RepID=A0ABP3QLK6_9BACI